MATTRRRPPLKWQPLAPPTPRVLNFPRRHVRRQQPMMSGGATGNRRGTRKLEALFDEERTFGKDVGRIDYDVPVVLLNAGGESSRRERMAEEVEDVAGVEAEMLRAECRFLRMERELALKKVKRNRARMERVLLSALQTLISGREKVGLGLGAEDGSVCKLLDEEIEAMRLKLVDLQRCSGTKLFEGHQSSSSAFDDQDSIFSRRIEMDGSQIPREIQTLAAVSLSSHEDRLEGSNRFKDMGQLLTSGTEEANGSMRLSKMGSSGASSASTSCRTEMPDSASSYPIRQGYQEGMGDEEKPCSGRCRAVMRRISEQVRFETEQWSQVLEMLEKVREEMEELQASKAVFEQQALDSKKQIFSLSSTVEAWKDKSISAEAKVNDLKTHVQLLEEELRMARKEGRINSPSPTSTKNVAEKQKGGLYSRFKENHNLKSGSNRRRGAVKEEKKQLEIHKRLPLLDIGNSSPLMRQITKVVFPGHRG